MIYVILGTTASGKTDLALKLARKFNMPLIGCDAFQIYKELIKGSAAPSEEELSGVKHHLISDHTIQKPINIAEYQKECRKILDEYINNGQDVIMCGGSFLYVKAALFSYEFPEEEKSNESFDKFSNDELYSMLQELDPISFEKIHKNNRKRIIRAIINAQNSNKRTQANDKLLYPAKFFAIDISKEENENNIVLRTEKMFKDGFVDEVKELIKDEKNFTTALEAIGYKQIIEGLKNGDSEEEMKNLTIIKTRQYAKRQRTFLRHQFEDIKFLKSEDIESLINNHQMMKKRTELALGKEKYSKIVNQNALICGVGGVGATLCESLCRLGVMKITIIDYDVVSASNLNRQILYDVNDIGVNKVDAAKEKLLKINPLIEVKIIKQKIDASLLNSLSEHYDIIFDCIDDVQAKVDLIEYSLQSKSKIIVCCGTAKKVDSTQLKTGLLSETGDPLAKAVKRKLKEKGKNFEKIFAVYSLEKAVDCNNKELPSLPTVPCAAGLAMVSYFIKLS